MKRFPSFLQCRHRGSSWRDEGPMLLILGALCYPPTQQRNLLGLECLVCLGRRHHLLFVLRFDTLNERTFLRLSGNYRRSAILPLAKRMLRPVEPQVRFSRTGVRPVTRVAVLRENRLHMLVERELLRGRCRRRFGDLLLRLGF